ncbi:MAG: MarC family protein [Chromatiales bacterium]|jgi:multiple antibiotic resistance protein|nr:MarC family protein [Chromatiales bacterium]
MGTFIVLLVVVNPIGLAPIFAGLTRGQDRTHQHRQAWHATLLATIILITFFISGDTLLRLLGIGLPAFRIAGGMLLFLVAIDMIFARGSGVRSTTLRERAEAAHKEDVSVFPLAFPLISGPGAITTTLLMANTWSTIPQFITILLLLILVLGLALLAMLSSPWIMRLLGETGTNVIGRLLGLMLAALAIQYMLDGLADSFPALMIQSS